MGLFSNVTNAATTHEVSTVIIGAGVAGGIIFGIVKKSGFWGTLGYTIAFGVAGVAVSAVVSQFTNNA